MSSEPAVRQPGIRSVVPEQRRREMPEQALWVERQRAPQASASARLWQAALVILWFSTTAAFAWVLYRVLSVEEPTILQILFLVLSTLCFCWVALSSLIASLGFVTLLWARSPDSLQVPEPRQVSSSRTALLCPVYREDPRAVAARIESMCRDLIAAGAGGQFDVFLLSDTQDEVHRLEEQRIYMPLRHRLQPEMQAYIRWRTPNEGKKAGNIRDWIERFGAAYAYFVVLDADSVMSAQALLRLVSAMDVHPRVGLIQTVPRIVGGQTLLARLQQFAGAYYVPVLAAGLATWHGHGGSYWGHNAIIRTEAFAGSAGLPQLMGKPPLGGHILSHDFVEAALLRRAGWEVHLVPSIGGTWEGCPLTLPDLMERDRRWAQGNLQHLRLLGASGLPLLSRAHLAVGACSYIASPIWALTLVVGVILALQAKYATPSYFGSEISLFPKWPVFDAQTALLLFMATILVVHLPKLLGAAWALRSAEQRARNGGVRRVMGGILVESVLSTLIAPSLMLTQTRAIVAVLRGRGIDWGVQRRVEGRDDTFHMLRMHRWQTLCGAVLAMTCWAISPAVLAWMSPIVVGLLLSAPIALVTARRPTSAIARLLVTPDELRPHPVLASALKGSLLGSDR